MGDVPFNPYSIDKQDFDEIVKLIKSNNIKTVLEFGPGASTYAFLKAGCKKIWSLENEDKWYNICRDMFKDMNKVEVIQFNNRSVLDIPEVNGLMFDLILVDGPRGAYFKRYSRINSALYATTRTNNILFHDSKRDPENKAVQVLEEIGWDRSELKSRKGMAFLTKNIKTLKPKKK